MTRVVARGGRAGPIWCASSGMLIVSTDGCFVLLAALFSPFAKQKGCHKGGGFLLVYGFVGFVAGCSRPLCTALYAFVVCLSPAPRPPASCRCACLGYTWSLFVGRWRALQRALARLPTSTSCGLHRPFLWSCFVAPCDRWPSIKT